MSYDPLTWSPILLQRCSWLSWLSFDALGSASLVVLCICMRLYRTPACVSVDAAIYFYLKGFMLSICLFVKIASCGRFCLAVLRVCCIAENAFQFWSWFVQPYKFMAHMLLEAAFIVVELWLGRVSIDRLTLMDVLQNYDFLSCTAWDVCSVLAGCRDCITGQWSWSLTPCFDTGNHWALSWCSDSCKSSSFLFLTSVSKTSNSIQSDSYLIISHNLPIIFHHHQLLLSLSCFRIFQVAKATGENPFSSFHRFWIFLSHHLSHTCSSSYLKFSCLLKSTSHGHRFLGYLRRNR